jgi:hypothetical protein
VGQAGRCAGRVVHGTDGRRDAGEHRNCHGKAQREGCAVPPHSPQQLPHRNSPAHARTCLHGAFRNTLSILPPRMCPRAGRSSGGMAGCVVLGRKPTFSSLQGMPPKETRCRRTSAHLLCPAWRPLSAAAHHPPRMPAQAPTILNTLSSRHCSSPWSYHSYSLIPVGGNVHAL